MSTDWEGKGGRYLTDCMEMTPFKGIEGIDVMDEGYADWAYDQEMRQKLWDKSFAMVGLMKS